MGLARRFNTVFILFFLVSPFSVQAQVMYPLINDTVTGTTANKLVKLSGGKAILATTADTKGLVGIAAMDAGTSGSVAVATHGLTACVFDGATTADNYVVASTTTAGACHDMGATYPDDKQVLGRVLSTNGAGGTYTLLLFPQEIRAPALIYSGNCTGCTVGAGITRYLVFGAATASGTETNQQIVVTRSGTLANFYFVTGAANAVGAGQTVTCVVRKNAANTSIQIVSSHGDAAQTYSDLTNTASVVAGDLIDVRCINSGGATSPAIRAYSLELTNI